MSLLDNLGSFFQQKIAPAAQNVEHGAGNLLSHLNVNPAANGGNNFWSTGAAQSLAGIQHFLQSPSLDTGVSPLPQAHFGTPYYNALGALSHLQQGVGSYAQNRVLQPIEQGYR